MLLTDIQKKALLREITENVGPTSACLHDRRGCSPSDILRREDGPLQIPLGRLDRSAGDSEAGSDSEAEELSECVACPHVGDPGDFLKHLDELLREFIRAGSGRASEGLSFCSLTARRLHARRCQGRRGRLPRRRLAGKVDGVHPGRQPRRAL